MERFTLCKRNNFPILFNVWKNQEATSILKQYTGKQKSFYDRAKEKYNFIFVSDM